MSELLWVLKQIGAPGSMGFFLGCVLTAFLVMRFGRRGRQLARVWLWLLVASYLVAATPLVAYTLAAHLPGYGPLWHADGHGMDDILVVLSGDNALERAQEARRILDAATPRCVVVSGRPWFSAMVVQAGVPPTSFVVDDSTETTRDQVTKLAAWADRCGARRVILVASVLSMPRIAAMIRSLQVPVVLAPSPLNSTPVDSGFRSFVPSYRALCLTRDALYEHLALAYYRHRQWIP